MNIAFVPVRCGSKSIPFKNIKVFCGKPLIYWVLNSLENAESIDSVVVATDCDEIKNVVENLNFHKVSIFNRSKINASDISSTESVMLEFIGQSECQDDDYFFLVQATSPFTQSHDFDNAFRQMNVENSDSLLSCVKTSRFLWNRDSKPVNYDFQNRPRRQDFNGLYMENGAFYISSVGAIKREKNRLSGKISIFEMDEYTGVELDEDDDWLIAEKLMYKYIIPNQPKRKIKLFLSDVDGVLTDAGMYYSEKGDELKKFNTHDGMGFQLLRMSGIKTGIITSENTRIVENRAKKLKVDYVYQGAEFFSKLQAAQEICKKENIDLDEVAYIGDDINCRDLLERVGVAACPSNAAYSIKSIPGIYQLMASGGCGAVREFADYLLKNKS
jgi:N-acylneuraminate cytidylyltransferase